MEQRNPLTTIQQYLEMYQPYSDDKPSSPNSEIIDTLNEETLRNEIDLLSSIETKKHEMPLKKECMKRLRSLSSRAPSPILVDLATYDLIINNDGCDYEKKIGELFYKLYKLLQR